MIAFCFPTRKCGDLCVSLFQVYVSSSSLPPILKIAIFRIPFVLALQLRVAKPKIICDYNKRCKNKGHDCQKWPLCSLHKFSRKLSTLFDLHNRKTKQTKKQPRRLSMFIANNIHAYKKSQNFSHF